MESLFVSLFAIGVIVLLILYDVFSWGFVCYKFYHWFVLTIFTGLPEIGLWQCIGLTFFIALFKNHNTNSYNKDESDPWAKLAGYMAAPWLLLVIGWFFI